ncbi:MAG: alpha-amylase, partial [Butyrivibrio sp.]|nr:alpha-amylase [Butyrivibrio sp.]
MKKSKKGIISVAIASAVLLSACGGSNGSKDTMSTYDSSTTAIGETEGTSPTTTGTAVTANTATATETEDSEGSNAITANDTSIATYIPDYDLKLQYIDDNYRTCYEVFLYSFYDSDGDGIGDIQGLIEKLDYINDGDPESFTDLGCDEIWLMPVCPSTTYHKYDVTDYMDIDPQYGTLEDFDELIEACHKRGINVILDTVINHTSTQHEWFKEAAAYLRSLSADAEPNAEDCPYVEYYNFSRQEQDGYSKLSGTNWYYEARFWSEMPDLNLENEAVRAELSEMARFWIDHGADGFRMDAVLYYDYGNNENSISELGWFVDTVKSYKSDAYIVGEAWTNQATYAKYYASGIDSLFEFDYSGSEGIISKAAHSRYSALKFASGLEAMQETYSEYNEDYIAAPFYTNHDMARSAGYYVGEGSEDMTKFAGALNLMMSGNAFIYYGEELGMSGSGKDENKRAPMYWSDDADAEGMCDGPADMDNIDMKYASFDEQAGDEYSIYNYYKKAIAIRNAFPVIARGDVTALEEISDDDVCFMLKSVEGGTVTDTEGNEISISDVVIAINMSEETKTVTV